MLFFNLEFCIIIQTSRITLYSVLYIIIMDDSPLESLSSLVRLSGVNVPARARFVGEALVSSTFSSLTLGLSFGMLGAVGPIGPLVPFMVGSWAGYTFGLINYWRKSSRTAFYYARQYPTLLAHSLSSGNASMERNFRVPVKVVQASELRLRQQKEDDEGDGDGEGDESTDIETGGAITLEDWIRQGGLGRVTWSMLAAQSCRTDVEELQRQERQQIVDNHQEKYG